MRLCNHANDIAHFGDSDTVERSSPCISDIGDGERLAVSITDVDDRRRTPLHRTTVSADWPGQPRAAYTATVSVTGGGIERSPRGISKPIAVNTTAYPSVLLVAEQEDLWRAILNDLEQQRGGVCHTRRYCRTPQRLTFDGVVQPKLPAFYINSHGPTIRQESLHTCLNASHQCCMHTDGGALRGRSTPCGLNSLR